MASTIALATFSMQSCTLMATANILQQKGKEYIFGADFNLIERQYAAADYLVQQSGNRVSLHDNIQIKPLKNLQAPRLTSKLAKIIPEQIGQRYIQLGYNIELSQVAKDFDESFTQNRFHENSITHSLHGTYEELKNGIEVNLRIQDIKSDRVESTFSYLLPYSTEIRDLAKPEAQIFTLQPEANK